MEPFCTRFWHITLLLQKNSIKKDRNTFIFRIYLKLFKMIYKFRTTSAFGEVLIRIPPHLSAVKKFTFVWHHKCSEDFLAAQRIRVQRIETRLTRVNACPTEVIQAEMTTDKCRLRSISNAAYFIPVFYQANFFSAVLNLTFRY